MNKLNNAFSQKNSIHSVTKPVLILARCFGVFPVSGLMLKSSIILRFSMKSPYMIIIILGLLGQATMAVLSLINLFKSGISLRTFQKFTTTFAGAACTLLVLNLGRCWPEVVVKVTDIEKSLSKFKQKKIGLSCNITALLVLSLAALDFFLSVRFYSRLTDACPQGGSPMESYYKYTTPAAAAVIPFTVYNFLLIQMVLVQGIFVCNFVDIFIIIISMYLTVYFEELNDMVILYKDKSPNIWNKLRIHYTKLTSLVKIVDEYLSPLVVFSFGCNMINVCIQIFKILRKDLAHATGSNCDHEKLNATLESIDRSLFYNFSVMFLIGRVIFTALFAARVHSTAKAPLNGLYEIPSCCYNTEARRFVEQIHSHTIALSGYHFFYITRNMILTMIATLFTYELVLLQFSM